MGHFAPLPVDSTKIAILLHTISKHKVINFTVKTFNESFIISDARDMNSNSTTMTKHLLTKFDIH